MKATHLLLICSALAGTAASSRADERKPFGNGTLPEFLKAYDVDADGKLSVEERQAYQKATREAAKAKLEAKKLLWDTDGDGKISETERQAATDAMRLKIEAERAKRFAELDKDADGKLSATEFLRVPNIRPEIAARILSHLDSDGDGAISKDEFLAALKPPAGPRGPNGPGNRGPDGPPDHG